MRLLLFLHGGYGALLVTIAIVYLVLVVILFFILNFLFFRLDLFKSATLELSKKRKIGYRFLIFIISALIVFLIPSLYIIGF